MNDSDNMFEEDSKVFYCLFCHSLCVVQDKSLADDDWDGTYCGDCKSTDIGVCTMNEWLEEEERRRKKTEEIEWRR